MTSTLSIAKAQFLVNMNRINGLTTLVLSSRAGTLQPTGVFQFEEASADIFRMVVVFLHATLEVLVRSQMPPRRGKPWTFSYGTDLDKALQRARIDAKPFKSLYPPLQQMAKRRIRIVHEVDFSAPTHIAVENWQLVDYWQVCMWNLAVLCFYYRLLVSTNSASDAERAKHEHVVKAMSAHVDLGNKLAAFPNTPPDLKLETLKELSIIAADIVVLLQAK